MKSKYAKTYYAYSATFRIFGQNVDFQNINETLRLSPTHMHLKGEKRTEKSKPYSCDMWYLEADVAEERDLEKHILWLKKKLLPHKKFIVDLKKKYNVDIFFGYRSNSDQGGFSIPPKCLELFIELDIPFGFSILCPL